jgi:hypothetical protein
MRTAITSLLIGVSLLAACDNPPTAPDARRIEPQAKPANIYGFGVSWRATKLAFKPEAINDAGMIAGVQGSTAVRWQNGTVSALGGSSAANCQGSAEASAISPSGIVAGTANGCVAVWTTPGVDPLIPLFVQPGVTYRVFAVYDDRTVLGRMHAANGHYYGFQVSPVSGLSLSPMDFFVNAADAFGNLYGNNGSVAVRWSAAHGVSTLPLPAGYTSGNAMAADARGDAIGFVYNPGPAARVKWNTNGTDSMLVNLPTGLVALNSTGRLVGSAQLVLGKPEQVWTSLNGALTQLTSPDSLAYTAMGVNSCGSIIASAQSVSPAGVLFARTSTFTSVCDQPPVILSAALAVARR